MNTLHFVIRFLIRLLVLGITAVLYSCSSYDKDVRYALSVAGENREELEKVLQRYKSEGDIEKYRAACFLIKNMPYHYWYEGPQIDCGYGFFAAVRNSPDRSVDEIRDSIANRIHGYTNNTVKFDILELDSTFICHSIDAAFKQRREKPWGQLYDFETFCEYVLPYRIGNERPEMWQDEYAEYFGESISHQLDTIASIDLMDVVRAIVKDTCFQKPILTSHFPCALPHIGASLVKYNCGTCRELNDYIIYACRSMGIPAALNFSYACSRKNVSHTWSSYWDNNGDEFIITQFPPKIRRPKDDSVMKYYKTKVHRITYSVNEQSVKMSRRANGYVPREIRYQTYLDNTADYTEFFLESFSFPCNSLYKHISSKQPVFLCSSSRLGWTAECYSYRHGDSITFDDIQYGEAQRLCIYEQDILTPITDAFVVNADKSIRFILKEENATERVVLFSKFIQHRDEEEYQQRMLNSRIEGAFEKDFRNPVVLCTVTNVQNRKLTVINTDSGSQRTTFPFIRYYPDTGSHCDIADLFLYDKQGEVLSGEVFGAFPENNDKYCKVFDGKSTTSYHSSVRTGDWVGIKLSSPKPVYKVGLTPRNRDNFIDVDNEYELYYLDKEWKSLGKKIAHSDSLVFTNVPKGALLLLSNLTHGQQERIFTYEEGRQVWR